jgi:hypothetical protein
MFVVCLRKLFHQFLPAAVCLGLRKFHKKATSLAGGQAINSPQLFL